MLTLFKRHTAACIKDHADKDNPNGRDMGRKYRRCQCSLHVEGHLGGVMIRKSLETSSWTTAQGIVQKKEAQGAWADPEASKDLTITDAINSFLSTTIPTTDSPRYRRQIRSILEEVDAKHWGKAVRKISPGLLEWCRAKGLVALKQVDAHTLIQHAADWHCQHRRRSARIRLLRRFFWFCVRAGWLKDNPAMILTYPKRPKPAANDPFDASTLPAEAPEFWSIRYTIFNPSTPGKRGDANRAWALVCLMRYAGLRISDAVQFRADRITQDGMILLRMKKTGQPVVIPMHPDVREALSKIQPNPAGYYFWTGDSKLECACTKWRSRLKTVFKYARVTGAHPHRFRHTFAVDLLLRGVPIDQVADLLGHASVTTTQDHYLAYVSARRNQIAASVNLAWGITTPPTPPIQPTPAVAHGRPVLVKSRRARKGEAA